MEYPAVRSVSDLFSVGVSEYLLSHQLGPSRTRFESLAQLSLLIQCLTLGRISDVPTGQFSRLSSSAGSQILPISFEGLLFGVGLSIDSTQLIIKFCAASEII